MGHPLREEKRQQLTITGFGRYNKQENALGRGKARVHRRSEVPAIDAVAPAGRLSQRREPVR